MLTKPYQDQVIDLLEKILAATIEPPRRPKTSADGEMVVRTVVFTTLNIAVQGPDMPVPSGFSVTVRQRQHTGTPTGGVGFTRNGVAEAATRIQLQDGESTPALWISNFKQLWFLADTADVTFEIIGVC